MISADAFFEAQYLRILTLVMRTLPEHVQFCMVTNESIPMHYAPLHKPKIPKVCLVPHLLVGHRGRCCPRWRRRCCCFKEARSWLTQGGYSSLIFNLFLFFLCNQRWIVSRLGILEKFLPGWWNNSGGQRQRLMSFSSWNGGSVTSTRWFLHRQGVLLISFASHKVSLGMGNHRGTWPEWQGIDPQKWTWNLKYPYIIL